VLYSIVPATFVGTELSAAPTWPPRVMPP